MTPLRVSTKSLFLARSPEGEERWSESDGPPGRLESLVSQFSVDFLESPPASSELRNHVSFEPVQGRKFEGTFVVLDNRQFSECRFEECILLYSGGPFALIDCDMDSHTFLELTGPAARGYLMWNKFHSRPSSRARDFLRRDPC